MFKIGEFSRLVRVSPRMLRYYEKCGLFHPARIDSFTGYRYYSAGQIPLLADIVRLRDTGFSVEEIGEILPKLDDPAFMSRTLRVKSAEVRSTLETEQAKLNRLGELSDTVRKELNIMLYDVEIKSLQAIKVLSLRATIPTYRDEGTLWERLGKYVGENRIEVIGGGYSIYYDEEYRESDVDVEIAVEVGALGDDEGDFTYRELDGVAQAATLRFSGPFDGGYDAASEKLANWMEVNGYAFAGPLRGHVISGPEHDSDADNWPTELQVPVQKI